MSQTRKKDTDYVTVSTRIHAMENRLLNRERIERMISAPSEDEALKVLDECGYDSTAGGSVESRLAGARAALLDEVQAAVPEPRLVDVFRLKYDYHNVKALLKAAAVGADPSHMLMDMGRVSTAVLREALETGHLEELPDLLAQAVEEAREVLDTTRDPQLSDIVLDRWTYREMTQLAGDTGSAFLLGYVRTQIDAANLRTLIRVARMGKSGEFLRGVLLSGGEVPPESVEKAGAAGAAGITELYAPTRFQAAAEAGAQALQGGPLTEFERLCDDAVADYLDTARYVPFGEAPLIGYLAARETEYTNLRILLMGRSMGLDPDVIRSRLRAGCV